MGMEERQRDSGNREPVHGDPLRAARGIAWGVVLGTLLWTVAIGIFVYWVVKG